MKKIALILVLILCLTACNKPTEPPPVDVPVSDVSDIPVSEPPESAPDEQDETVDDSEIEAQDEAIPSSSTNPTAPAPSIAPPASQAPPSSTAPLASSSAPPVVASQPTPSSSSPNIQYNSDGSYSTTITLGGGSPNEKRESANGGTTYEEALEYMAYAQEYAESIGMIWSEDAKDGGFEPAISTDSTDMKASIRSRIDYIRKSDRDYIFAELSEDPRVKDEWHIVFYR